MCGIAGILALDPRHPVDPSPLTDMLRRLAHRGPDDQGVYAVPGAVLGHRRLSVIDVAGGHQPLFGARPGTAIVANGEIYNYRELAGELRRRGHHFRTASDTEVAAHAYDAWDLGFLDRLDGMFALAIWDGQRRRLVLARDRLGEKPLYYTVTDGLLLFASELSALLAHPAVSPRLDPAALSEYLLAEYVAAPRTILEGVHKLRPGERLTLEDGRLDKQQYWRLPPAVPLHLSYADAVATLRQRLEEAVRSRLVADVPLGIFLSGGIDSSTVAALAARAGALETFAIGFRERSFDESEHARQVAQHIGSHHHERIVEGKELPELVPRLGALLDEPLGDASILPTAILSAFARQRVTVALGGDGGDELFAGYPMHQAQRVAGVSRAFPGFVHALARAVARRLPVSHGNFAPGFKVNTFLRGAAAPPPRNHALWMSSFQPGEQATLLEPDVWAAAHAGATVFEPFDEAWEDTAGWPLLARATMLDACTYLPNDILTKVDRASMAVALEVRAPLLARALVEFAFALPDRFRMHRLTGKRLFRDAVRDLLPPTILARPKKGFGMPVAAWLNGALAPLADDLFSSAALRGAGLFRPAAVARLLREHRTRRADHRKPLWTLLVFELWRRHHLTARTAAPVGSVLP